MAAKQKSKPVPTPTPVPVPKPDLKFFAKLVQWVQADVETHEGGSTRAAEASVPYLTGKVTFPQKFKTKPTVVATALPQDLDDQLVVCLSDVQPDYFAYRVVRLGTAKRWAASVDVHWVAVGMRLSRSKQRPR